VATLPLPKETIYVIAQSIRESLEKLGYAHVRKGEPIQSVRFRRILVTEQGTMLLLEVDTQQFPKGVRADHLTSERTLHHLTTVVHYPVKVLNTTGVTYAVILNQDGGRGEIPSLVRLSDALEQHPGTPLTFPAGEGPDGPIWAKLSGHFLVGGETGSGKTTWLLSTALALARTTPPERLQIAAVDLKGVDFFPLAGLTHLVRPIASNLEEAEALTCWLVEQIEMRRQLFLQLMARDLETYNARLQSRHGQTRTRGLAHMLVIVDEVTELALRAGLKSVFYKNLIRLSSMGRSFGIHLILATQNPKSEVLDTLIRGNLAARIAFRVTTSAHSRTILGMSGAESLPAIPGRMLARLPAFLHRGVQPSQKKGRFDQSTLRDAFQELQGYRLGEEDLPTTIPGRQLSFLDR
jgi:DNA segregation ATPase FtsK/SpoIIIE-like protein